MRKKVLAGGGNGWRFRVVPVTCFDAAGPLFEALQPIVPETRRTGRFGGGFSVLAGALDDFHAPSEESGRSLAELQVARGRD